jgi:hypothetical protein
VTGVGVEGGGICSFGGSVLGVDFWEFDDDVIGAVGITCCGFDDVVVVVGVAVGGFAEDSRWCVVCVREVFCCAVGYTW